MYYTVCALPDLSDLLLKAQLHWRTYARMSAGGLADVHYIADHHDQKDLSLGPLVV
jgi:hypothetical protein